MNNNYSDIQLIVGLGNPGPEYRDTRHNVGAWLVHELARLHDVTLAYQSKFFAAVAPDVTLNQCRLLIPSTFMNESGKAVAAVARFYKIPTQSILVAHDELDFAAGTIRLKVGGGHGGHNGLRSMINALGSNTFLRLRIGIAHPGHRTQVTPYVLAKPSQHDKTQILAAIDQGIAILPDLINGDVQAAFRLLHQD